MSKTNFFLNKKARSVLSRLMSAIMVLTMIAPIASFMIPVAYADAPEPTNLALGGTAYASFARAHNTNGGSATAAIDGNSTGTRWVSDKGANDDWIYVDLGEEYDISEIVLKWEGAYGKEYKIQISDDAGGGDSSLTAPANGSYGNHSEAMWSPNRTHAGNMEWTDVYTESSGNGATDTINTFTGAAAAGDADGRPEGTVRARSVRMQGVVPSSNEYKYSIWEFEIWGTPVETEEPPVDPDGSEIHVATTGNDTTGDGTVANPYLTINKAAQTAQAGDTVIVHEGLYREVVRPARGGTSENARITYTAADGEEVVIKGSEEIDTWQQVDDSDVWKVTLANTFFGSYNPYTRGHPHNDNTFFGFSGDVTGDEATREAAIKNGLGYNCGDVYLDGEAYRQKGTLADVGKTEGTWFSTVNGTDTTIYANFDGANPNDRLAEINVRQQVFAPDVDTGWGLKYVTVRGFTIMHAANWYSDFPDQARRGQMGAISVSGGKSWIIENNRVVNARSIGIDIGLVCDIWAGNRPATGTDSVKTAYENTDDYGTHIVRNNYIARCGQSGVAGVFSWSSEISHNMIEDTNYRNEFSGAETAPIKVHYNNYGLIKGNYIKNSQGVNSAGIWTDWGNQGIRVTGNIVVNCPWGYYAEAAHGPILVDNNVFIGNSNIRLYDATGVVFANNLFVNNGSIALDGPGRGCYYFEPGTMNALNKTLENGPAGENREKVIPRNHYTYWYNNLSIGTTMPQATQTATANDNGASRTATKHNTFVNASTAISNFDYTSTNKEMDIEFDFNSNGVSLVPATKAAIGDIVFFGSDFATSGANVSEQIPDDVLTDFFGENYAAGSGVAGPFANIVNGTNEITLWPMDGQTPTEPVPMPEAPENLSRNPEAKAYASYARNDSPTSNSHPASKVLDGDANTRWATDEAGVDTDWIYVDLGDKYDVDKIMLNWEKTSSNNGAYGIEYRIEVSEGAGDGDSELGGDRGNAKWNTNRNHAASMTWTPVYTETDGKGGIESIKIRKSARSIRMQGIRKATNYGYSIREFEIYGSEHTGKYDEEDEPVEGTPATITVDFDNERGPMIPNTGVMLVPNEHLTDGRIIPLNVDRLRDDFDNQNILNHTPNNQPTVFEYEDSRLARARSAVERLDSLGIAYDPILCYVPSWMYKDSGGSYFRAPSDMDLYKQWVKDNVQYIKDNDLNIDNLGVWNEYWGISKDDYNKMYVAAWEGIKEVMPDIKISGPSNGKGDATDFLAILRKNNVTIDNLSWHLLSRFSLNSLKGNMDDLKTLLPMNQDIGVNKLYLEEYQCSEEALSRGSFVNWLALIEDTGVDLALKAHWFGKGYEGFGDLVWVWNQTPGTDVLENKASTAANASWLYPQKQPNQNSSIRRDTWWVMKAYAEMSGVNVEVEQPTETLSENWKAMPKGGTRDWFKVRALASKDVGAGEAKILLGSDTEDQTTQEGFTVGLTLNLNNRPFVGENSKLYIYKIDMKRSDWATVPSAGGVVWKDEFGLPQPNRFIDDSWDDPDGMKLVETRSINNSDSDLTLNLSVKHNDVYMVVIKKDDSAPGSFCLMGPDDDVAVGVGTTPTFTWQKASGATSYDLKVATDKNFENVVFTQNGISGESYTVTSQQSGQLTLGTRYYWAVTAKNASGSTEAAHGMYYNFIVSSSDQVPGRFTMYLPANYSTGASITPKFTWAHAYGATSFKLQVSTSPDFSSLVMDKVVPLTSKENDGNMGGDHYVYKATAADNLQNNTKYYSRVLAVNSNGDRIMSGSAHEFTTRPAGNKPGTFAAKPLENADNFSMRGSFNWEVSNGAFFYKLEIATDSAFSNIVTTRDYITTNGYTLAQDELNPNTQYYWRVTAYNAKAKDFTTTNKKGNIPDEASAVLATGSGSFKTENKASAPLAKAVSTGDGSGTATVYFKPVRDAVSYSIKYGTASGVYDGTVRGVLVKPGEETGSKMIKGLTDGQTYYIGVISIDADGNESEVFNEVVAVPVDGELKSKDLALNKQGFASSSEASGGTVTRPPSMAFDGDAGTRWASRNGDSDLEWIYVDLGTECVVTGVQLFWEAAYGKIYTIDVSDDGKVWKTVFTQSNGQGGIEKIPFDQPETARYVRMNGTKRGPHGWSLWSFEVYGSYISLATGKPAEASSNAGDAQYAFDESATTDTSWQSAGTADEWIQVDLGRVYDILGAKLDWKDQNYAEKYEIQVSNSQSGPWTTVYTENYGEQQTEEIEFDATPGRFVRLKFISGDGSCYDLVNFDVYGLVIPPVNIALNKTATASSSAADASQVPSSAVDGNYGTRWASESLNSQWIYIDLGDIYDIFGAKIAWEASFGKRHKLQIASENPELEESWTDIHNIYDLQGIDCPGGTIDYNLSATGRYVRMQGLQRSNNFGFSMYEFEIYGTLAEVVPADKTELIALLSQISDENPAEEDYTAASWSEFAQALEDAVAVAGNNNATQAQINAALEALQTAYDDLVEKQDAVTYNIDVTGGTSDKATAAEGETVTITAVVPDGKYFVEWESDDVTFENAGGTTTSFTMPAKNVAVTAIFDELAADEYSISVTGGTANKNKAGEGDTVTVTAQEYEDKVFVKWTSDDVTFNDETNPTTTFEMPASNVLIIAEFEDKEPDPDPDKYTLTIEAQSGGMIIIGTSGEYGEGERIALIAAANTGYQFDEWVSSDGGSFSNPRQQGTVFTMPANATTVTAKFKVGSTPVDPPVNPPSKPSSGGSGGSRAADAATDSTNSTANKIPVPVDKNAAVIEAKSAVAANRKARFKNAGAITLDTMKAMTAAANGKSLKVNADSMNAAGTEVEVRIFFDPAKATKDINLYGTVSLGTQARRAQFEKWFSNKLRVISLRQQGDFGMTVEIAAKVDLTGMDTKNLYFYSYHKATNTYKRINTPKYWIDANGYLHFTTDLAGDIVVSDGKLTRK